MLDGIVSEHAEKQKPNDRWSAVGMGIAECSGW